MTASLSARLSRLSHEVQNETRRTKSLRLHLSKRARLWFPFDKRLILPGVRDVSRFASDDTSNVVIRSSTEVLDALGSFWGTVHSDKETDPEIAQQVIDRFVTPIDLSNSHPPSPSDYVLQVSATREGFPARRGRSPIRWMACRWHTRSLDMI